MDEIVKLAMAKWPKVPHCFGWLMLDARGDWRMRDERAQALQLSGDKIHHEALIGFINRNYESDTRGYWYFQNGPQRVYVNLQATPYILRYAPQSGLHDHTGAAWTTLDQVWFDAEGKLIARLGSKIAQLDDRDLAQCLDLFRSDGNPLSDDDWQSWMSGQAMPLQLHYGAQVLQVERLAESDLAQRFGFCSLPQEAES